MFRYYSFSTANSGVSQYKSADIHASGAHTAKNQFSCAHHTSGQTVNQHEQGFTLIEMLTTLAIAALILTMATPSVTTMVQNNRLSTQTNQFVSAMTLARSEAIKQQVNINVVATNASHSTDEWGAGWRVEIDGGATLRTFIALEGSSTLNSNSGVSSFQYQPSGRANATDSLSLCDERTNETGRLISVSATGRVSVIPQTCP